MSGSISSFVAQFFPQAQQASAATGLPVDYILGQAGLESGWGTSTAATSGNNYFGISQGGSLLSYGSAADSFTAFANLMNSGNYAGAAGIAGAGGTALDIGNYVNAQGYSTTPDYGTRVAGDVASVDSALAGMGLSGGISPGAGSTAATGAQAGGTAANCAWYNPTCWAAGIGAWIGGYATRAALLLLAVIFIAGALFMLASRTQIVEQAGAIATGGRV